MRDIPAVDWVDAPHAVQAHAGLLLVQLRALQVGLGGGGLLVGGDLGGVLQRAPLQPLAHQLVLGGEHHIGGAKEGVRPGGVDHDGLSPVVACEGRPPRRWSGRSSCFCWVLTRSMKSSAVQIVDQALGVLGDAQHPLALLLADDGAAAALAHALHYLLVGQHALAGGAPVHRHSGLVGQAVLIELEEDPLGPLVVAGIGGVDLPAPVEGVAQHL